MTDDARTEQFVRLQSQYRHRVFAFILTLVSQWDDAEEVMQETSTILWRKFDQYEAGTDFVRWANQVAYFEVQKFRKRQRRGKLLFGDEFIKDVADESQNMGETLQQQGAALSECLKKLSDRDRRLLDLRYRRDATTKRVADQIDRTVDSVYKSLRRIRTTLLVCMRRWMAREQQA